MKSDSSSSHAVPGIADAVVSKPSLLPAPTEYPNAPCPLPIVQTKPNRTSLFDQTGVWLLVSTLGLALSADLLVLPLMNVFDQRDWGAVWVYACMGLIGAQGGALTIWLA